MIITRFLSYDLRALCRKYSILKAENINDLANTRPRLDTMKSIEIEHERCSVCNKKITCHYIMLLGTTHKVIVGVLTQYKPMHSHAEQGNT